MATPIFIRMNQCDEMFNVSSRTIRRWAEKSDKVQIYKIGGSSFVKVAQVVDYIQSGV